MESHLLSRFTDVVNSNSSRLCIASAVCVCVGIHGVFAGDCRLSTRARFE